MALQVNLTNTTTGVNAQQAYVKIETLGVNKNMIDVSVFIYFNASARNGGKEPLERRHSNYPYADYLAEEKSNAKGILAFVYTQLKQRPEFVGSIDC